MEIKPSIELDNRLFTSTSRTVSYPYFTKEYFWQMWCARARFPIEGYKTRIKWSINIQTECADQGCCGGEFRFFLYPYGPDYDYVYLDRCQSATLTGSAEMDKDYYAWSGTFIGFAINNYKPVDVIVNTTGDTVVYNFFDTGGAVIQGTVELTAENPWASLCPTVILSDKKIGPGDTITVSVMGKDTNGNLMSYPAYPQYQNPQYFDYSIISGTQYGKLAYLDTPYPYQDTVMTMISPIPFIANTSIDEDSVIVVIRARFYGVDADWGSCGPAVDTITIKNECIFVASQDVAVGDTILLSFINTSSGNPVPMNSNLDVAILGGDAAEYGTLLVGGTTGTSFSGVKQPIKYIAPKEISGEELDVQIVAVESDLISLRIQDANTGQSIEKSLSKTNMISQRIVAALKTQGSGASCPIGSVKVIVPVRIELEIEKNILKYNESTALKSILYSKNQCCPKYF